MHYYRARYYDPKAGRFISEDPISFLGGKNFYAYVENNPATFTDPSGLGPWDDWHHRNPPTTTNACSLLIGIKALPMVDKHGPRFTHCWASCEIRKNCGMQAATSFGMTKEWADYGACAATLGLGQKWCNSAFQDSDAIDNEFGRSCPAQQGCWERCKGLLNQPDAPGGPFSGGPFGF